MPKTNCITVMPTVLDQKNNVFELFKNKNISETKSKAKTPTERKGYLIWIDRTIHTMAFGLPVTGNSKKKTENNFTCQRQTV